MLKLSWSGPVVRFGGLHPEAVMGGDVLAAGAETHRENLGALFAKLKHENRLERFSHRGLQALTLKREPGNPQDSIGIWVALNGEPQRVGSLPKALAARIVPLMDQGHDFNATLTRLEPFQHQGERYYRMTVRLEYTAKPGRPPNRQILDQVGQILTEVRESGGFNQILTVIPEELTAHDAGGQPLLERLNQERHEVTYYLKGRAITPIMKLKTDPTQVLKPVYLRSNVPQAVQREVARLLNRDA